MPSVKRLPSVYTPCAAVEKKRPSGLRPIVKVYRACVRPILEYACEAWHNNHPVYLSKQIEQILKSALRIIYPSFTYTVKRWSQPTFHRCTIAEAALCERLFHRMLDPGHRLNSLVPVLRINEHNLRHNRCFKVPVCRTDRYHKSFIPSVATLYDMKHF